MAIFVFLVLLNPTCPLRSSLTWAETVGCFSLLAGESPRHQRETWIQAHQLSRWLLSKRPWRSGVTNNTVLLWVYPRILKEMGWFILPILVPLFNIAFACCVCKKLSDTSVIFVLQGQRSGCKRKASIHHAALACTNCFRFGKSQAAWAKLPTSAAWRHTVAQTPSFRPQNLSDGTLTNKRVETSDWQIGGPFMSLICQCQCSTHSHCGRRKCAIWFSKKQPLAATCQWLQVAASGCKWLQVAACGCLWLRGKWLQVAASRCKWLLVAAGQVAASGCGASDCKWRQVAASGCGPSGCLWLKVAASRCLWLRGKWLFFKTWSAKEWWHIARQFVANSVDQWQIL